MLYSQKGDSKIQAELGSTSSPVLCLLYWNHFPSLVSSCIINLNHAPLRQTFWSVQSPRGPHRRLPLQCLRCSWRLVPPTCAGKDDSLWGGILPCPALRTTLPKPLSHALFLSEAHPRLSAVLPIMTGLSSAHADSAESSES